MIHLLPSFSFPIDLFTFSFKWNTPGNKNSNRFEYNLISSLKISKQIDFQQVILFLFYVFMNQCRNLILFLHIQTSMRKSLLHTRRYGFEISFSCLLVRHSYVRILIEDLQKNIIQVMFTSSNLKFWIFVGSFLSF